MATARPLPLSLASYANSKLSATKAAQKWLDDYSDIEAFFPSGTFLIDAPLTCTSPIGRKIKALPGTAWLKKTPDFPKGQPLFKIETADNLSIDGLGFDGDYQESWLIDGKTGDFIQGPQPLLTLLNSNDVEITNCCLKNNPYMLIEMSACERVNIHQTSFRRYGRKEQTTEGGAAIWMNDESITVGGSCIDVTIDSNEFSDGEWSAIYLGTTGGAIRPRVTNNKFIRLKESTIFGAATDGIFTGNLFEDIKMMMVAAHPFEIGGYNNILSNNIINGCDGEGIHIVGIRFQVTNNILRFCVRDLVHFPGSGAISVFSANSGIGPVAINILGNLIESTGTTPYGIVLARANIAEGSEKISDVSVGGNLLLGTWSKKAIACDPSEKDVCGKNVIINDKLVQTEGVLQ